MAATKNKVSREAVRTMLEQKKQEAAEVRKGKEVAQPVNIETEGTRVEGDTFWI